MVLGGVLVVVCSVLMMFVNSVLAHGVAPTSEAKP
jgi:hypothetical protein